MDELIAISLPARCIFRCKFSSKGMLEEEHRGQVDSSWLKIWSIKEK